MKLQNIGKIRKSMQCHAGRLYDQFSRREMYEYVSRIMHLYLIDRKINGLIFTALKLRLLLKDRASRTDPKQTLKIFCEVSSSIATHHVAARKSLR